MSLVLGQTKLGRTRAGGVRPYQYGGILPILATIAGFVAKAAPIVTSIFGGVRQVQAAVAPPPPPPAPTMSLAQFLASLSDDELIEFAKEVLGISGGGGGQGKSRAGGAAPRMTLPGSPGQQRLPAAVATAPSAPQLVRTTPVWSPTTQTFAGRGDVRPT